MLDFLEKHIDKIIEVFDFENRKENKEECVCYKQEKKCHEIENLNCFLCYCPEYDSEVGCKINSLKGKWLVSEGGKVWDCSGCDYPHREEVVRKYLRKLFGL
ncbi:cysteine-rich small domain-containing protein [Nanoarchaeota archaeon]